MNMTVQSSITQLITPAVTSAGFFLEEVHIANPGNHRIVTCIIDGTAPLNLDQVTEISRVISALLDEATFMDDSEFTLEVSSPGLDRPLTQERHWKKNLTRLIKVTSNDGSELIGRLKEYDDAKATLVENIKGREKTHVVAFSNMKRAVVEVEFNRKGELS